MIELIPPRVFAGAGRSAGGHVLSVLAGMAARTGYAGRDQWSGTNRIARLAPTVAA